jgi:sugar/nucleoside kinase (ribokinase family)
MSAANEPFRRLVFAGQAIVDVVLNVPSLPERGGDMLASSATVTAGGGFNTMAAAARQGLPVLYAAGHGTGPWGDVVRAALVAEGVGLLRPADPDRDTGFDVVLVDSGAQRTFVTHAGAEAVPGPGGWNMVPAGPGDVVYVSGYGLVPPDSGAHLGAWAAALPPDVPLFFDPGPLVTQIPAAVLAPVLARCDWLSCNQREAALLAGAAPAAELSVPAAELGGPASEHAAPADVAGAGGPPPATEAGRPTGPDEATRHLLAKTGRADVIVRAGDAGCYVALRESGAPVLVPAPRVTAVDTTGAGDAHSGVFLAALAEGRPPLDAAAVANAAAALSVTRPGPATSPTRSELAAAVCDSW